MSRYTEPEIAAVYRAMRERRDMRHFLPHPVDPAVLSRWTGVNATSSAVARCRRWTSPRWLAPSRTCGWPPAPKDSAWAGSRCSIQWRSRNCLRCPRAPSRWPSSASGTSRNSIPHRCWNWKAGPGEVHYRNWCSMTPGEIRSLPASCLPRHSRIPAHRSAGVAVHVFNQRTAACGSCTSSYSVGWRANDDNRTVGTGSRAAGLVTG